MPENEYLSTRAQFLEDVNVYQDVRPVTRSHGTSWDRTYVDYDTNLSIRSEFHRGDYEYFRPNERVPRTSADRIKMSDRAYKNVGIIKNTLDVMSEFGVRGIRIQHPIKAVERFYNRWFERVYGYERSERFLSYLYRRGNVVVQRDMAKLPRKTAQTWKKLRANTFEEISTKRREIPVKYTFIDVTTLKCVGGSLVNFTGKNALVHCIPGTLRSDLARLKQDPRFQGVINNIPKDIKNAAERGLREIPLDPEKTEVFYYKRDDWEIWAESMIEPILDDIVTLEKMKLADLAALDGAISNVRLWTIGFINPDNPEASIFPKRGAINKLRQVLANSVGGGTVDVIWGPELNFKESATQVWRFLGSDKYKTTLDSIYDGLGIPPTLRSSAGRGGNSGNFIGLKTMVERLEYGRRQLEEFWKKELEIVQKAMGFAQAGKLVFDSVPLSDEAAEKKLLIDLWDRDVIPTETILELFGRVPDIEDSRLRKEYKKRGKSMPEKSSPYHNPDKLHDLHKILLQGKTIAPSELGIELQEKAPDDKTPMEREAVQSPKDSGVGPTKKNPQPPGRPPNVTETRKRKPKPLDKPTTRGFLQLYNWSKGLHDAVHALVAPAMTHAYGKKDLRSLTKAEFEEMEMTKADVMLKFKPYEEITAEKISEKLSTPSHEHFGVLCSMIEEAKNEADEKLKVDEVRDLFSIAYALINEI